MSLFIVYYLVLSLHIDLLPSFSCGQQDLLPKSSHSATTQNSLFQALDQHNGNKNEKFSNLILTCLSWRFSRCILSCWWTCSISWNHANISYNTHLQPYNYISPPPMFAYDYLYVGYKNVPNVRIALANG